MIKQKKHAIIEIDNYPTLNIFLTQDDDIIVVERENLQQLIDELTEIQNQTLNKILDK